MTENDIDVTRWHRKHLSRSLRDRFPCNILSKRKINSKRPRSVKSNYELSCIIFILNAYRIYIIALYYTCTIWHVKHAIPKGSEKRALYQVMWTYALWEFLSWTLIIHFFRFSIYHKIQQIYIRELRYRSRAEQRERADT